MTSYISYWSALDFGSSPKRSLGLLLGFFEGILLKPAFSKSPILFIIDLILSKASASSLAL